MLYVVALRLQKNAETGKNLLIGISGMNGYKTLVGVIFINVGVRQNLAEGDGMKDKTRKEDLELDIQAETKGSL